MIQAVINWETNVQIWTQKMISLDNVADWCMKNWPLFSECNEPAQILCCNQSHEFMSIIYLKQTVFTEIFFLFTRSSLISEVMTRLNEDNRMFIDAWTEKYVCILPAWSSKHICSESSANQNITSNCGVLFIAIYSHKLIVNE